MKDTRLAIYCRRQLPKLIHTLEDCVQRSQRIKVPNYSPRIFPVTEDYIVRIRPEHATAVVRHPVRERVVHVPSRIELHGIGVEFFVIVHAER